MGALLSGYLLGIQGCFNRERGSNYALLLAQTAPQSNPTIKPVSIRFRITDLGTLGFRAVGKTLNNRGLVIGTSSSQGTAGMIFLWKKGKMRELGTLLGKTASHASDINNLGHIVGSANRGGSPPFDYPIALLWKQGKMERLFPDNRGSSAIAINDRDGIVGAMFLQQGLEAEVKRSERTHAFWWFKGVVVDLGTLSGGSSWASDINVHNQIVGSSEYDGGTHAFLWEKGKMHDLGTLGGKESSAHGINDLGQVVGSADTASGDSHAFLWEKGVIYDLGSLGKGSSHALKINKRGQVVGYGGSRALLWEDRKIYDLNALIPPQSGWVLESATGINDRGQIVGTGSYKGQTRAFLLTPIPQKRHKP